MKLQPHAIKMEYIGAFSPPDAEKLYKRLETENIEFYGEEDESVHNQNSSFDLSPGRSTDHEIHKVFVHNRDIKRAVSICNDMFDVSI